RLLRGHRHLRRRGQGRRADPHHAPGLLHLPGEGREATRDVRGHRHPALLPKPLRPARRAAPHEGLRGRRRLGHQRLRHVQDRRAQHPRDQEDDQRPVDLGRPGRHRRRQQPHRPPQRRHRRSQPQDPARNLQIQPRMTIEELLRNTVSLPPAPEVLPRLVRIMRDPDTDARDVVQLISTDAAIAAGVLRLSNSAAYAQGSAVADLHSAVARLGIKEVYRIVNLVSSGAFLDGALPSMDLGKGSLWEHSLAVALIMDDIAENSTGMEGLPYTLGLLHDVGKLLLHHGCGERYVEVFAAVESERISIEKAEIKTLGFDHALAGARMLAEWSFPEEIYSPVRFQYHPTQAPAAFRSLAGALHVANWGAATIGCNDGRDAWALDMVDDAFAIDQSKLENAIINARERLEKAKRALVAGL